ncbi:DUF4835 family protein [candidate division KSB1 bacterium]|nr:DUF4835 family protein [candidate division KSB1 bacterium]
MRAPYNASWLCLLATAAFVSLGNAALADEESAGKGNRVITAKVTVIVDKLPQEKKTRMANFAEKVQNYINNRKWIEEDYVHPFQVGFQFFLEDNPSGIEDRYRCSIIANGPDIQYYDKRALFPFQEGEVIEETAAYVPVRGLIDFFMFMIIGNELDKYGASGGDHYFAKARSTMQEGKYSLFAYGWDMREDLVLALSSDNYKKFREMKDYFFYGLWSTEEAAQTRHYLMEALKRLEEVLKENKDNLAAKNFVDAHYQEFVEVFKQNNDTTPFEILLKIDPDRKEIYNDYIDPN